LKRGFQLIDHTADAGIRVWGRGWKEIIEEAARGMVSLIVDLTAVLAREEKTIRVEGENGEEILLNWLREILFLMEQEGMVFSKFKVEEDNFSYKKVDKYWFSGKLVGEKVDPTRHDICTEIKAVTRHNFFLRKKGLLWEAEIIFDL